MTVSEGPRDEKLTVNRLYGCDLSPPLIERSAVGAVELRPQ